MSSNNDNVMARFLYAILEQKNLKDIDWNKVARNPILSQEITNGHAARMRYSRFRASLLGIEPQKRSRNINKSKVTKSKKESKGKKEKEEQVKPDPDTAPVSGNQESKLPSPKVKNETLVKKEAQNSRISADIPSVSIPDTHIQFANRLLTPCSDNDLFAPSHGYSTSPARDMLHHDTAFDYAGAATTHCAHEQPSWQPSPSYSPFQLPAYELESYNTVSAYCDHQHVSHPEGFGIAPSVMMAPDHTHVPVKHEEWDSNFH